MSFVWLPSRSMTTAIDSDEEKRSAPRSKDEIFKSLRSANESERPRSPSSLRQCVIVRNCDESSALTRRSCDGVDSTTTSEVKYSGSADPFGVLVHLLHVTTCQLYKQPATSPLAPCFIFLCVISSVFGARYNGKKELGNVRTARVPSGTLG